MDHRLNNQGIDNPFETRAYEYDHWFDTHAPEFLKQQELIRSVITTGEGIILDIGCGSGRFSSALGIPYGIEPSRPLARMASEKSVMVVRGYGEFIPFRDRSIRQVFLITVLGFVKSPGMVLKEIRRCLRPGGSLILVDIDMDSKTGEHYRSVQISSTFLSHAHLFSSQELFDLLHENGYSIMIIQRSADLILISGRVN